ncbi:putative Ubiquitin carboxyl-terminal hydrolase 64E, partial [Cardiosporidium cionae]
FSDLKLTVRDEFHGVANDSLEKALQNYLYVETLEGDNQYACDSCNKKCDAFKGTWLAKLPPTLTIQIKRFLFDFVTLMRTKVNDKVSFPSVLNMNAFVGVTANSLAKESAIHTSCESSVNPSLACSSNKNVGDCSRHLFSPSSPLSVPLREAEWMESFNSETLKQNSMDLPMEFEDDVLNPLPLHRPPPEDSLPMKIISTPETFPRSKEIFPPMKDSTLPLQYPTLVSTNKPGMPSLLSDQKVKLYDSTTSTTSSEWPRLPFNENPSKEATSLVLTHPHLENPSTPWIPSPEEIEEESFLNEESINKNILDYSTQGPYVYELYAILVHSGSAMGGHYFAYIKNLVNRQWYCFNDSVVSLIQNGVRKVEEFPKDEDVPPYIA